ncbi:MAG: hypothetical protein JXJ22_15815 [Bacteroidales bacterium]|nr:hypothetical protein [Bacteroidales bacterium]
MLEHQKIILANISENKELFRKELLKSVKWLNPDEIIAMYHWLNMRFGTTHKKIINEVFDKVAA